MQYLPLFAPVAFKIDPRRVWISSHASPSNVGCEIPGWLQQRLLSSANRAQVLLDGADGHWDAVSHEDEGTCLFFRSAVS